MKVIGPAQLANWAGAVDRLLGCSQERLLKLGLFADDFSGHAGVLVQAEDGSALVFRHAFAVRADAPSRRVAVFTEHSGYLEVELSEDDELLELAPRGAGEVRWPGKAHCIPFAPCPLCNSEVEVIERFAEQAYFVQCPGCGLQLGEPHGYASCLDMVRDWNRRSAP